MKIAQNQGEKCENKSCKYCSKTKHLCKFGLRDIGCYIENQTVNNMANDFIKALE